jgi:hypothetical protein
LNCSIKRHTLITLVAGFTRSPQSFQKPSHAMAVSSSAAANEPLLLHFDVLRIPQHR